MNYINLICSTCGHALTEFETSKFHRLQNYWGGTRKVFPKCVGCYNEEIRKRAYTISEKAGNEQVAA